MDSDGNLKDKLGKMGGALSGAGLTLLFKHLF
jgi:hypothetical protein